MTTNPLIKYTLGKCLIQVFLFRFNPEIVLSSKSQSSQPCSTAETYEGRAPHPTPGSEGAGEPQDSVGRVGGSRLAPEPHLVPSLVRMLALTSPSFVYVRLETMFPVTVMVR